MKNLWVRSILPLMVASLLVACGSSGGDSGTPVTRTSTPEQTIPTVNPEDKPTKELVLPTDGGTDSTKGDLDLTADENESNQNADETEDGKDQVAGSEGNGGLPVIEEKVAQEKSTESESVGTKEVNLLEGMTANEVFTGASTDYLRTYFTEFLNTLPADAKKKNANFARTVESARARIDQATGEAIVSIQFKGEKQAAQFSGSMGSSGVANLGSNDRKDLIADMVCLNASTRSCTVSMLRLETTGKNRNVGFVLIRHTNANVSISIPTNLEGTNDYLQLLNLFANTKERNNNKNSIKKILVETFEVIGGSSGVKVAILSKEQQLITATSRLVAMDDGGDFASVKMSRQMNLSDLVDIEGGRSFKTDIQQSISDIYLIGNDGRGRLRLAFTVPGDDTHPQRDLQVGIERVDEKILTVKGLEQLIEDGSRH